MQEPSWKERPARRRAMRQKDPLRALSTDERSVLRHLSRSSREPAVVVARAKAVLAVAQGASYTEAARAAGRRSGDAVGLLVGRFNQEGGVALVARGCRGGAGMKRALISRCLGGGRPGRPPGTGPPSPTSPCAPAGQKC